jgi:hypothetical protein
MLGLDSFEFIDVVHQRGINFSGDDQAFERCHGISSKEIGSHKM